MRREIDRQSTPEVTNQSSHPRSRRSFLTEIAAGTLGIAALPGLRDLAEVQHVAHRDVPMSRQAGRRNHVSLRELLGPDGLPRGSVAGSFLGTKGRMVLVGVTDPPVGVIRVRMTGRTEVWAHGSRAEGDVSACRPGDRLNIGTYFAGNAQRVAIYINANALAYWAETTKVSDKSLTAVPDYSDTSSEPMRVWMIPWSTVYSRDPDIPPAHGEGAAKALLNPGDGIHMTCLGSSHGPYPETLWGVSINQLTG